MIERQDGASQNQRTVRTDLYDNGWVCWCRRQPLIDVVVAVRVGVSVGVRVSFGIPISVPIGVRVHVSVSISVRLVIAPHRHHRDGHQSAKSQQAVLHRALPV